MEQNQELSIWQSETTLSEIKKCFAPKLADTEFLQFISMGKATGLNPFLREIWAVKYKDSEPAQVFVGRDGYRKSAQMQPDYDYHICDAVYENDKFLHIPLEGKLFHQYQAADRGKLIGAYAFVKRKTSSKPQTVYVAAEEYLKYHSVWKEKPSTMLKKVAEAQALRMAFQKIFAGTYSEFETWKKEEILRIQNAPVLTALPPSSENPFASQTIDVPSELQDVMPREEKDKLISEIEAMDSVDTLKKLWEDRQERVLSLPRAEKTPLLGLFNARKKKLNENKTPESEK